MGLNFTSKIQHDTYPKIDTGASPAPCGGKTVLVTGAAKGIARSESDATATRTEALQAAKAARRYPLPEIVVLKLDVTDYASVEACVAGLRSRKDWEEAGIDILVNNAGYLAPFEPLGISDKDDWWRTWEVNVRGVYWVLKEMLPLLLKSKDKTVVNLTSVGALGLSPGASSYQPSKLAVIRLTEYLMIDYGQQGLLAYSVHPASVPTDLAKRMPDVVVKAVCVDTTELAGDCIALLTRERREWLAGRYISCTWDMPELVARQEEIGEKDLLKLRMSF
ncbi:hypothetical protein GE09DRAFT_1177298 [Coniochaeta sp. 2T2.1]|nr:hypothetical protein GE09DRAFT_1177298 [Coniochaeta sp. 2T2.1]